MRRRRRACSAPPITSRRALNLLSNGRYSVMLTAAGSGYSRCGDIAVTRWREDPTCDPWGSYVFLRDAGSGRVWSAGYQPVGCEPDSYQVSFFEDRAEISRRDGAVLTSTEILVSPEDDAEVRRISVTNEGGQVLDIELTSYAEVVLSPADADSAHPAFSKMFVSTEFAPESGALLATRRGRDPADPKLWAAQVCALEGEAVGPLQFETDRARFLGRGRDLRNAACIGDAQPLSNTVGTVLDPVLALRRCVRIPPGRTARLAFWTSVSASREQAIALAGKQGEAAAFERAKAGASAQAQAQLRRLGLGFEEAETFQRIANRVLYSDASLRGPRDVLGRNSLGQSALWPQGISGDLPMVLVGIDDAKDLEIIEQLLRAQEYWRLKRLAVDVVILNESPQSSGAGLQQALDAAIRASQARHDEDAGRRGPCFRCAGICCRPDFRDLLLTAARAVFAAGRGTLSQHLAGSRSRRSSRGGACTAPRRRPRPWTWPRATRRRWSSSMAWADSPRRARVRRAARPGSLDAGAVEQCAHQCAIRLPGVGGRFGQHLVSECATESAHALVQRSGQRWRPPRRSTCATRPRGPCGAPRRCPYACPRRPTPSGTASATAASSMPRTALRSICCSSCRSRIRSRFRASRSATWAANRGSSP